MDFLQQTHENAKAELQKVEEQIAALSMQRDRLLKIIEVSGFEPVGQTFGGVVEEDLPPMWQTIQKELYEAPSFTIGEAIGALERHGYVLSANKYQIVRNVLTRKEQIFEPLGNAKFSVRPIPEAD